MKKLIIFILASLICMQLAGQIRATSNNEIQILLNQARVHESRNQFRQALDIYESLYEKHPQNEQVVESYLRVLYLSSDKARAGEIISDIRTGMSAYFVTKQECLYLIKTGDVRRAEQRAFDWLHRNPGTMHHYRELATIFEGAMLFEIAIRIYERNRQVANDQNLYALELSNAHYFLKNVDNFFIESLKFLRQHSSYLYFYRNRFKEFVQMDSRNIRRLDRLITDDEPEQVHEIYAFTLVEVKDFQRATTIYEKLPVAKMVKFADDLVSDGHLDFALSAYQRAIQRVDSPIMLGDIQMKMARVYFEKNDIDRCIEVLAEIINNEEIQRPPHSHRTRANKESRLLMALISIMRGKEIAEVTLWYDAASQFANNQIEKSEILYGLSRYLYLKGDYVQAYRTIETALSGQDSSTNIFKQSFFYRYEIALFQHSDTRDSLLTECIIHFPGDHRVTDMLFFETFLAHIPPDSKAGFLQAIRYKGLYQNRAAVETLMEVALSSQIDELFLLAFEWGVSSGHYDIVASAKEHAFRNPVYQDFIFLQTIRNTDDVDERKSMISNFLNNNPQNVFSPQLRLVLFGVGA
jgi:tetratricopeptide (TPR) repeat protein